MYWYTIYLDTNTKYIFRILDTYLDTCIVDTTQLWQQYVYTFNSEIERDRVAVDTVTGCTAVRVVSVRHIFTDDKNRSLYDGSTVQVCPMVRRRGVAFCWTLDSVSRTIDWLSVSYPQISWRIYNDQRTRSSTDVNNLRKFCTSANVSSTTTVDIV